MESVPNAGVSESEVNEHGVVPAEKFNAKHLPPQVSASGIQILDASPFLPAGGLLLLLLHFPYSCDWPAG